MPVGPAWALEAGAGERLRFSDAEFVVYASAVTTGDGFTIIEEIAPLDTPLHVHEREDELFYVSKASTSSMSAPRGSRSARARRCLHRAVFHMRIVA